MLVSIIIPVHNAQNSIQRCVDSIVQQMDNNLEVILIENNSKDKSLEICMDLSKKYSNVVCIETKEKGVSAARNIGLEIAKGDVIGFCDADDFLEDDSLKHIVKAFEENVDIVITGFYIVTGQKKRIPSFLRERDIASAILIGKVLNDNRIMGCVWNKFFRAYLLKNIRFNINLSYCEDTHFNVLVLSQNIGCVCRILDVRTYNYVKNSKSVTANVNNFFDEQNRLKYINSCYQILRDCKLSREQVREVKYAIVGHAINVLYNLDRKDIPEECRKILLNEIKREIGSFLLVMWKYNPKHNVKRIMWIGKTLFEEVLDKKNHK